MIRNPLVSTVGAFVVVDPITQRKNDVHLDVYDISDREELGQVLVKVRIFEKIEVEENGETVEKFVPVPWMDPQTIPYQRDVYKESFNFGIKGLDAAKQQLIANEVVRAGWFGIKSMDQLTLNTQE